MGGIQFNLVKIFGCGIQFKISSLLSSASTKLKCIKVTVFLHWAPPLKINKDFISTRMISYNKQSFYFNKRDPLQSTKLSFQREGSFQSQLSSGPRQGQRLTLRVPWTNESPFSSSSMANTIFKTSTYYSRKLPVFNLS